MFQLQGKNKFFAKCLFYYLKIFSGITITFSTALPKTNGIECWAFRPSKLGVLYNLLLMITLLTSNSYGIIYIFTSNEKQIFEKVSDTITLAFTLFTAASILINFLLRQKSFSSIANRLSAANALSIAIDHKIYDQENRLPSYLMIIFLMNLIIWMFMVLTSPNNDFDVLLYYFMFYISIYVIDCLFMQYIAMLKLLHHLFKVVNKNLTNFAIESKWNLYSAARLDRLLRLRRLHVSLSDLAHDLSDFYSGPILLCVGNTFIAVTNLTYYIVKPMVLGISTSYPLLMMVHVMSYGLLYVVMLFVLTKCVSTTVAEVNSHWYLFIFIYFIFIIKWAYTLIQLIVCTKLYTVDFSEMWNVNRIRTSYGANCRSFSQNYKRRLVGFVLYRPKYPKYFVKM